MQARRVEIRDVTDIEETTAVDGRRHQLGPEVGAEPGLPDPVVRAIARRLQARHPRASLPMVLRSIDHATASFVDAHVRLFLPILIERAASSALAAELRSSDDVRRDLAHLTGRRRDVTVPP